MSDPAPTVAILNSEPSIITLVQMLLEDEGYQTVVESSTAAPAYLATFLIDNDPAVVLFDVPPPYAENCRRMTTLRAALPLHAHRFIVTTTNPLTVAETTNGADPPPIVSLPFEIEVLLTAVRDATRRLQQKADETARNLRRSRNTIDRTRRLLRCVQRPQSRDEMPR